jgi:hypothetical protein
LRAQHVDRASVYDSQDVRLELAARGVDALGRAPNRQKRVLDDILGRLAIAKHPVRQTKRLAAQTIV